MTSPADGPETIHIQDVAPGEVADANAKSNKRWDPEVNSETLDLFSYLRTHKNLGEDAQAQVLQQATEILGRCVPPSEPEGQDVGLVIGYVQSGKTMSFTTVTALARDNGYPIIVVLTGTSVPLFKQSRDRLSQDLRCSDASNPNRNFLIEENPSITKEHHTEIQKLLSVWRDPEAPEIQKRTLVLLVMKNVTHLRRAKRVMLRLEKDLKGVPVLIIDDEADQASLNNQVNKGTESPTYTDISELRQAIPHHSYLQYTATPQAPLLINVIDTLSPKFAQVLTPGDGYTGGKTFFQDHPELVKTIPEGDLPTREGLPPQAPESLKQAMRLFYLGVAAAYHAEERPKGNRSMMVHPAVKREVHHDYLKWVKSISSFWRRLLQQPDGSPAKVELLEEFENDHKDLSSTVKNLPNFAEVAKRLRAALEETKIIEVNTRSQGKTPEVDWKKYYPWILVGGTALDRGFTVEGLTVTYMPREGGLGNADTIQQRARFFGYKGSYLGFCRVFLPEDLLYQYRSYTIHEENVRRQLIRHILAGKSLNEWKRAFLLDGSLRPTRDSVLDLDYYRIKSFTSSWLTLKSPHRPVDAVACNRGVVTRFLKTLECTSYKFHEDNTASQTHQRATTTLRDVYENLLVPLSWGHPQDTANFTGMLLNLENRLVDDEEKQREPTRCEIYVMSANETRERTLNSDIIKNLYQGKDAGSKYPGDRKIRSKSDGVVTVQIHRLNVRAQATSGSGEDDPGMPEQMFEDVYTVAVHSPFGHGSYQQEEDEA